MKKWKFTFKNQDATEMDVATKAKLPHWKHKEQYPENWDSLSADRKRWEFVRRNEDYRAAYDAITSAEQRPNKLLKSLRNKKFFGPTNQFELPDPQSIAAYYGLSQLLSPSCLWDDRPKGVEFSRSFSAYPPSQNVPVVYPLENGAEPPSPPKWEDCKAWIEIDLNADIGNQLISVLKTLEALRPKAIRAKSVATMANADFADDGLWCDEPDIPRSRGVNKHPKASDGDLDDQFYVISLLRICDARICGARFQRIAEVLSDQGYIITADSAGKRFKFAQQCWKRFNSPPS